MRRRDEYDEYYQGPHDERVEPHHDLVPGGMPDPNWGGVIIHPDQKKMPVGDPTLWANTVTTIVDANPPAFTPRAFYGEQIILAQAADRYARSWSLSGTITANGNVWESFGQTPFGPVPGTTRLMVFLSVLQGIEKIVIEHQICLISGGVSNIGLANNQCTIEGGPYLPMFSSSPPDEFSLETRSFALIGALIGNTISVRGFFVRGDGGVDGAGQIPNVTLSCILTPYAPGHGI